MHRPVIAEEPSGAAGIRQVVAVHRDSAGSVYRFVIRPNRSLSWRATRLVFAAVASFSLGVALLISLAGAWPVIPFAGLEVMTLGTCLYLCARRTAEREVINISASTVAVERGRYRPVQRFEFARPWAQVALRPAAGGDRSRLLIGCNGRLVEVGACLLETERRRLAQELRLGLGGAAALGAAGATA